jgi:hypothetical protein
LLGFEGADSNRLAISLSVLFSFLFLFKNQPNLSDFLSLMNIKMGEELLLLTYFDHFDFMVLYFLKM